MEKSSRDSGSESESRKLGVAIGFTACPYTATSNRFLSFFYLFFYNLLSQWEFLPWEIRVAFPREESISPLVHTPGVERLPGMGFTVVVVVVVNIV